MGGDVGSSSGACNGDGGDVAPATGMMTQCIHPLSLLTLPCVYHNTWHTSQGYGEVGYWKTS